jgi:hypothetical protein
MLLNPKRVRIATLLPTFGFSNCHIVSQQEIPSGYPGRTPLLRFQPINRLVTGNLTNHHDM